MKIEDALLQYRNPKLYGLWINSAVHEKSIQVLTDSGYVDFGSDGTYSRGGTQFELKHSRDEI